MNTVLIKKAISIEAPKEKVWAILLNDAYTRIWYEEFSLGARAETTWEEGTKVVFTDLTGSGMVGHIVTNQPYQMLTVEYQGLINAGEEDYDSAEAQGVKGGRETYIVHELQGGTELTIESDMAEEYYETMSRAWDRALQKIKALAEATR